MASDAQLPEYHRVHDALQRTEAVLTPSEVHGVLIGQLINFAGNGSQRFLKTVLGDFDAGDVLMGEAAALLEEVYRATREQLLDEELGLDLLLPEDDAPIEMRVEAASDWARGLIYGLAEQGIVSDKGLSPDVAEFLADCRNIANMDLVADGSEDDERVYYELVEYLRVGVLMVQEELQPMRRTQPIQ